MRWVLAALSVCVVIAFVFWRVNGFVRLGVPKDPNDPKQAGILTPDVLRRNLHGASDSLLLRAQSGEISDAEYRDLLAQAANDLLDQVEINRIDPKNAWEYGQIYITARRWEDARRALEMAVKVAKGEDRRVNDNLQLARVLANLDRVKEAVQVARKVLNAPDEAAAPILPATLLEIVPAGEGKGQDVLLAELLEQAIDAEMRTIVDATTDPGKAFLLARPYHIRHAWQKVRELYRQAGREDLVKAAEARAAKMLSGQRSA